MSAQGLTGSSPKTPIRVPAESIRSCAGIRSALLCVKPRDHELVPADGGVDLEAAIDHDGRHGRAVSVGDRPARRCVEVHHAERRRRADDRVVHRDGADQQLRRAKRPTTRGRADRVGKSTPSTVGSVNRDPGQLVRQPPPRSLGRDLRRRHRPVELAAWVLLVQLEAPRELPARPCRTSARTAHRSRSTAQPRSTRAPTRATTTAQSPTRAVPAARPDPSGSHSPSWVMPASNSRRAPSGSCGAR